LNQRLVFTLDYELFQRTVVVDIRCVSVK
jgi:hypothetical protein